MTRDEIIRLAKEAGFHDPSPDDGYMGLAFDYRDGADSGASLERFAALVAAAEREACADLAESFTGRPGEHDGTAIAAAIRDRRNQPPRVEE